MPDHAAGSASVLVDTNTQTFDGDGQVVKYTRSEIFNGTAGTDNLTYYLRSTVLGGRVISEYVYYGSQGSWSHTYVYAGSERIGSLGWGSSLFNRYRFADPITGDEILTMKNSNITGGLNSWTTLDTNGVDVPLSDPFPQGGEGSNDCEIWDNSGADGNGGGKEANLYPTSDGGARCMVDGVSMECSFVSSEAVRLCPDNDCGGHAVTVTARAKDGSIVGSSTFFRFYGQAGWDGSLDGNYLVGSRFAAGFNFNSVSGAAGFLTALTRDYGHEPPFLRIGSYAPPTRGGQPQYYWLHTPPKTPIDPNILTRTEALLKNPNCSQFVNGVLGELGKATGRGREGVSFEDLFTAARGSIFSSAYLGSRGDGGTQLLGAPGFNINILIRPTVPTDAQSAPTTIIHEIFHDAPSAGAQYTHTQMVRAAFEVANTMGIANDRDNPLYGGKQPKSFDPAMTTKEREGVDNWNSSLFQSILMHYCR